MKAIKIHLTDSDLTALDTIAAKRGIKGLRAPGARAATVRDLIREAMAEGCPPEAPGGVARCCIGCGHRWTGALDCPECGEPGEPGEPQGEGQQQDMEQQ
jgi:hypothetical protein